MSVSLCDSLSPARGGVTMTARPALDFPVKIT